MKARESVVAVNRLVSIYQEAVNFNRMEEFSLVDDVNLDASIVIGEAFMIERFENHLQKCRFCLHHTRGWCDCAGKKKKVRLEGSCGKFYGGGPLYEEIIRRCFFPEGERFI